MRKVLFFIFALCSMGLCAQVYRIYPVPHLQLAGAGKADFSAEVNIVAESGIDKATIDRAKQILADHGMKSAVSDGAIKGQANLFLGVNGSKGVADKKAGKLGLCREVFAKEKFDRHIVSLSADKLGHALVVILGENTDATFCGLASLEQMLDGGTKSLPCVTLYDYADVKYRGVIEGYYGVPYTAEVTKDLFRFMARYKLNTYMYGAKSDPYHSRFWSDPYPTQITKEQERIGYLTQDMMREITDVSHATKVNFIWAIHPGTAFTDAANTSVNAQIMKKFESMYGLGVRQFGVFVDDVGVPSDAPSLKLGADRLTELQNLIDQRWNTAGAAPADTVKSLHYVPQLYAYSWVSRENAIKFFESLSHTPAKVNIYITGANVWSVPNNRDLQFVKGPLGRDTSWWWNYPCNDNDVTKLFMMDMYANFRDERHIGNLETLPADLTGLNSLIINPMQQGEASKIALFSMADYAWNHAGFDNSQSWEAALPAVVGEEMAPVLRRLIPYLRYFDRDAMQYQVNNYKEAAERGNASPWGLVNTFKRVHDDCQTLAKLANSSRQSDRLLYEDLRPWVQKLDAMALEASSLLKGEAAGNTDFEQDARFQFPILVGMGDGISLSMKTAEPSAEVLRPFIDWLRAKNNR